MEDTLAERIEEGEYVIEIHYDRDPQNPREEYDHVGVMVCEHRRYTLGDKDARYEAMRAVRDSRDYHPRWEDQTGFDFGDPPQLWEAVQKCRDIISMPLYLYDHGGITMSTSKFSCPWDSGQIGFIFCTKAKAMEEWGQGRVLLTPGIRAKAEEYLRGEVKEYDQYLTGDVYRIVVTKGDEEIESCCGFYGMEYAKEAAMEVVNADKATAEESSAAEAEESAEV